MTFLRGDLEPFREAPTDQFRMLVLLSCELSCIAGELRAMILATVQSSASRCRVPWERRNLQLITRNLAPLTRTLTRMIDYSKIASEYAKHRQVHPRVLENLISEGNIGSASTVLEVGCGTGNYVGSLNQLTGCSCYGIDPSEEMLSNAKKRFPLVAFRAGKAEKVDFDSDYFDLAFSVDVIHHVADRPSYLREAYRTLKRGGRICTVTDSEWIIRNRQPLSFYFPETVDEELKRYPSVRQMMDSMRAAGFRETDERMAEFPYKLTDLSGYRSKVFSSLLLISDGAFKRGLKRMEEDLAKGPIPCVSRYSLLWGIK